MVTLIANFANISLQVVCLAIVIEKANKCLDFVNTVFLFHFLLTWIIYKFPTSFNWWMFHALIITVTVLSSEYVCYKLETAEIKLSFNHIIEKGKEFGIKGANIIKGEKPNGTKKKKKKNS